MILKNLLMVKKISIALLMIISTPSFIQGVNKLEVENSTKSGFTNTASSTGDIITETQPDTTWQIKMGSRSVEMEHNMQKNRSRVRMYLTPVDKFKGHWGGIELGFNNYSSAMLRTSLSNDSYMHLNAQKSLVVGLNILPYSIGLQKGGNNFGMMTGMGLTVHNYRLDSQNILKRDNNGHTTYEVATRPVNKNKITATYLTIPLLLEIQFPTSHKNRLYISGGFYGGFKLGSHTKVMYNDDLENNKVKSRADLNIHPFRYGATIRAGYGIIQLFATADLSPMFQSGYGPELYPWSIGLSLITF